MFQESLPTTSPVPKNRSQRSRGSLSSVVRNQKILKDLDFTQEEWTQAQESHKHFKETAKLLFPFSYNNWKKQTNFDLNYHVNTFCLFSHKAEGHSPNIKNSVINKYGVSGFKSLGYASKEGLKVCFFPQWVVPKSVKWGLIRALKKPGSELVSSFPLPSGQKDYNYLLNFSADQDCYAYRSLVIDIDSGISYGSLMKKLESTNIKQFIKFIIQTSPEKFHLYISIPRVYHVNYFRYSPFANYLFEHQDLKRKILRKLSYYEKEEQKLLLFWKILTTILGGDPNAIKISQPFQAPGYLNPKGNIKNPQFRATCVFTQPQAELVDLEYLKPIFQDHLPFLQKEFSDYKSLELFGIKFPDKVYLPEQTTGPKFQDSSQKKALEKISRYKKLKQQMSAPDQALGTASQRIQQVYPVPSCFEEFKVVAPRVSSLIPDSLNIANKRNFIVNAFASYLPHFLTPQELAAPSVSPAFSSYISKVVLPYFEARQFDLKSSPKWKSVITSHLKRWCKHHTKFTKTSAAGRTPAYWKELFSPNTTPESKILHDALMKSLLLAKIPERQVQTLGRGILWPLSKLLVQESYETVAHNLSAAERILFGQVPLSFLQYREYGGSKPFFLPYSIQRLYGNYDPTYQMKVLLESGILKKTGYTPPVYCGQRRKPNAYARKYLGERVCNSVNHMERSEFPEYFEFQKPKCSEILLRIPEIAFQKILPDTAYNPLDFFGFKKKPKVGTVLTKISVTPIVAVPFVAKTPGRPPTQHLFLSPVSPFGVTDTPLHKPNVPKHWKPPDSGPPEAFLTLH